MPILWGMTDGNRQQSNGSRVACAVQSVEQAVSSRGRQQRADVGLIARIQAVLRDQGRHGAPSPWRLSSEIGGETLGEGSRR